MRHLTLALTLFAGLNLHAADTTLADVTSAMSRGSIVCSTAKANLKVAGVILDDNSQGINFSYTNGMSFTHKFIGKTTAANGQITIHGYLVSATNFSNPKSWFALSEETQGNEVFSSFKFSPVYRTDGLIIKDKVGRINIRCTNLKDAADFLPEITEEQVSSIKAANQ